MNDKESQIYKILDICIDCCSIDVDDNGTKNMSRKDITGNSRVENIVMTRCMFAVHMKYCGYSVSTIAQFLHKTEASIRNMFNLHCHFLVDSKAYRVADAEVTLKCKEL